MPTTGVMTELGRLSITPACLEVIPSQVMTRALRAHQYTSATEGQPFHSLHSFEGARYRIDTNADRSRTEVRLEVER